MTPRSDGTPIDTGVGRAPSGQALAVPATPLRVDGPSGFDPSRVEFWPFRITSFAPSHRQFRLDCGVTEAEITKAVGCEPKRTPDGDKVTLCWEFWAELTYKLPEGGFGSTSMCCKIWDYCEERWSAYGWPEVFEQVGLTPLLTKEYGDWQFQENGNPTLQYLRLGLAAASGMETRSAIDPQGRGPKGDSPTAESGDAQ